MSIDSSGSFLWWISSAMLVAGTETHMSDHAKKCVTCITKSMYGYPLSTGFWHSYSNGQIWIYKQQVFNLTHPIKLQSGKKTSKNKVKTNALQYMTILDAIKELKLTNNDEKTRMQMKRHNELSLLLKETICHVCSAQLYSFNVTFALW